MRRIFVCFAALAICTVASAQDVDEKKIGLPEPWNQMLSMSPGLKTKYTVEVEYSPTSYHISDGSLADMNFRRDMNTVTLGFIFDTPVSRKLPLYLDYGLKIKYTGAGYGHGPGQKMSYNYTNLTIPLSVMMHTDIANTPLAFAGFLGFDGNFWLQANSVEKFPDGTREETKFNPANGYNVFTFDWHIGCRVYFFKYFFGIGYQGAITPFYKDDVRQEKFNNLIITLGYTF